MTYPYIGSYKTTNTETIALFTGNGFGINFDDKEFRGCWSESLFKNITSEYLANTHGEVKSKEHAEFIVRLCKNADIIIYNDFFNGAGFFYVFKNELVFSNVKPVNCARITIPLPPECEELPEQVIAIGKMFNRTSDGLYRWVSDCGLMESIRDLKSLKEADDFSIVSYESGNDEWPKVGDDAEICESPAFELSVKSSKFIGKKGIVRAKFENSDGVMVYVLEVNTENVFCFYLQNIKKPKTPEQELRDFLYLLWRENNEDFDDFADIAVLHLTKKGEGDD